MLKLKGFLKLGIMTLFMVTVGLMDVSALSGSAKLSYEGASNVTVGETFKLELQISDIVGEEIAAIGTQVVFDDEYLELVDSEGAVEPYGFQMNKKIYKLAGLSLTGEGITEDTTIYTFYFKALKSGNITIGYNDQQVVDKKAETVNATFEVKEITIEDVVVETEEEVKEETPELTVETKEETVKEENEPKVEEKKINISVLQEKIVSMIKSIDTKLPKNNISNVNPFKVIFNYFRTKDLFND